MKAPIGSQHGLGKALAVAEIAFDALEWSAGQAAQIGSGPQERSDSMSAGGQFMDQVSADETRSAGNEAVHPAPMLGVYRWHFKPNIPASSTFRSSRTRFHGLSFLEISTSFGALDL